MSGYSAVAGDEVVRIIAPAPSWMSGARPPQPRLVWRPKDPFENLRKGVDLVEVTPPGDQPVQLDVSVAPLDAAGGLACFRPSIDGTVASAMVGGGNDGEAYAVGLFVTFLSGRRMAIVVQMAVSLRAALPPGSAFAKPGPLFGPDGTPLLGPTGEPLYGPAIVPTNAITVGGVPLTVNGFPITVGTFGANLPTPPVRVPDHALLGPSGQPLTGPDGKFLTGP